jgi:hypothetical protein
MSRKRVKRKERKEKETHLLLCIKVRQKRDSGMNLYEVG